MTRVSGRKTHGSKEGEYLSLLIQFPPRPIHTEADLEATMSRIETLLAETERSEAEDDYLVLLSDLVERWEDEHVEIPPISGVDMIKALLEDRGLRQRDLAAVFGTDSIV